MALQSVFSIVQGVCVREISLSLPICYRMEAFSRLILRAVRGGFLSGCQDKRKSGDGAVVTHLLFTDDTLVFCEAFQDQMAHLSWLLMWFEAISGLRINLDKSEILPVGRVENLEALALEVGCKVGRLPNLTWGSLWGESQVRGCLGWGGREISEKACLVEKELYPKAWNWRFANEREALWRQVIGRSSGRNKGAEAWLEELWDHSGDEGNAVEETKDGIFSVKSLYSSLASRRDVQFPYSNIWSTCVPTKVSFFAWEAYWGKVLTLDQLKKRGRSLAIDASFAVWKKSQLIIFLFSALRQEVMGVTVCSVWCYLGPPFFG
ncbi:hypothetical protein CK203_090481 [Vitis vinifera]|uniref:Reverse transcriptase zinc-binding domain-containing protein n=1 Tax=Vitis vinifera TaxID=29760 RepID=A0A438BU56_VITVI|nr:hypothetical protein CK203_090481 [Vitis vinifera]